MALEASVRDRRAAAVIDLWGEVTAAGAAALLAAYETAAAGTAPTIVLNCRKMRYINSQGVALLVELLKRARRDDRTLIACGLAPHFAEIFEITRLSDLIPLYEDERTALGFAQEIAAK
ncbi:MAG: STAS domain-containing protein [Anaerolineae bacterium]|nr:STAS domain-containing protein [Anaerolineae bacterium]